MCVPNNDLQKTKQWQQRLQATAITEIIATLEQKENIQFNNNNKKQK